MTNGNKTMGNGADEYRWSQEQDAKEARHKNRAAILKEMADGISGLDPKSEKALMVLFAMDNLEKIYRNRNLIELLG